MSAYDTQKHVSVNAEFLVILGALLAALGLIAILAPLAGGLVEPVVGVMVLCKGAMQFYYGVRVRHWGSGLGSYMGLGSILMSFASVCVGVLLIMQPLAGIQYMAHMLAIYLVLCGGFDVLHGTELRETEGWYFVLGGGLLTIVLGLMIWMQWPWEGSFALGFIVGANMIVNGLGLVGLGRSGLTFRMRQQSEPQRA